VPSKAFVDPHYDAAWISSNPVDGQDGRLADGITNPGGLHYRAFAEVNVTRGNRKQRGIYERLRTNCLRRLMIQTILDQGQFHSVSHCPYFSVICDLLLWD